MELIELQIGHSTASAPGEGNTITRRTVRIACIEIGFACTAGRQCYCGRTNRFNITCCGIEYISALNTILAMDKVNNTTIREYLHVVTFSDTAIQRI